MVRRGDKTIKIESGEAQEKNWMELLAAWFLADHRKLPWRNLAAPDPYHVWISEIMLQQTRVEAVKGYFLRFMKRLPDVYALSEVAEDDLMKLWEGLGYYSRARNLKKCAMLLTCQYGGKLPQTEEKLIKLPGIGPYTAGAIASIAYHEPVAAVDGNVLRVMSRLKACKDDITLDTTKKKWKEFLQSELAKTQIDPGIINQAIMELGAVVCLPNGAPNCLACPLDGFCQARQEDRVCEYPVKTALKKRRIERRWVYLIINKDQTSPKVLLHKRPQKGLLAGLYEFPNRSDLEEEAEILPVSCLVKMTQGQNEVQRQPGPVAKHIFTHIEWHMQGVELLGKFDIPLLEDWVWADLSQIETVYAIPGAFLAYVKRVKELLSME